ncbi:MAG: hypothetical protein ACRCYS_17030 [Beijerinckiaceae bacterium]
MACDKIIGVKNLMLTFTVCETGQVLGPISHKLATDDLPNIRFTNFKNEPLRHGYSKRIADNATVEVKPIGDERIQSRYYQGDAEIKLQIEYENGRVVTGEKGTVTGDEKTDTFEYSMMIVFPTLEELLPPGALLAA